MSHVANVSRIIHKISCFHSIEVLNEQPPSLPMYCIKKNNKNKFLGTDYNKLQNAQTKRWKIKQKLVKVSNYAEFDSKLT